MSFAESDELPSWSLDARETGEVQKKKSKINVPRKFHVTTLKPCRVTAGRLSSEVTSLTSA